MRIDAGSKSHLQVCELLSWMMCGYARDQHATTALARARSAAHTSKRRPLAAAPCRGKSLAFNCRFLWCTARPKQSSCLGYSYRAPRKLRRLAHAHERAPLCAIRSFDGALAVSPRRSLGPFTGPAGSCPAAWCSWRGATTVAGQAGMIRLPRQAG